ncbi:unnamed protein product [Clonostachys rosea]|uniref:Glucose-methanol-choline oxidoreductase N-terminal domain-containing protein n=1 Tax=Bionectria ochroleuca TaxID=29856 RepID=A0ABY6U3P4_BIOOC|nr:unnamed protein product [Clonostachys rosea]
MASTPLESEYDFIVCGGGTSGCVLAGRLAESPVTKILVIEAGQHNEGLEDVHMPGGFGNLLNKETDWNIASEPAPGINGRQIKLSRGKFLGGTSGCNGTVIVKGSKLDYDDWGVEGWGGEEFFRYMQKAETFHPKPWFQASTKSHGYNGPLHTEIPDVAPISNLVLESMMSHGLPLDHDLFAHGEKSVGCGYTARTTYKGTRSTAADFITKDYTRSNVTIATQTYVDKVLFDRDSNGELSATGVQILKQDGRTEIIRAKKEVILTAGAFCSPALLNRSGIGAPEELKSLGVETLVPLPGVGKNLMDHMVVFMFYETEAGLTHDEHVHHGDGLVKSQNLWRETRRGFQANYPSGVFAFTRLDDRLSDSELWKSAKRLPGRDPMGLTLQQPSVEYWNTQAYGGPNLIHNPEEGTYVFGMVTELFGQQSRGRVVTRSTDPRKAPEVSCNHLSEPLDVEVLAEGCRLSNDIMMSHESTSKVIKGAWPRDSQHHKYTSREQWADYVRNNAETCFHYSGTCRMGSLDDPEVVVDSKLRVKGVKKLRVADCSIIPILPGGHAQMPAYGIGEKAADLIKAAWGLDSSGAIMETGFRL